MIHSNRFSVRPDSLDQAQRLSRHLIRSVFMLFTALVLASCVAQDESATSSSSSFSVNSSPASTAQDSSSVVSSSSSEATVNSSSSEPNVVELVEVKQEYRDYYANNCSNCHGDKNGSGIAILGGALTSDECEACSDPALLVEVIVDEMPPSAPGSCDVDCATELASYILLEFAGFNNNAPSNVVQFKAAGDVAACEKGVDVTYGGMRRLTRLEYNQFVKDLFKDDRNVASNLSTDDLIGNFTFNTETPLSEQQVSQYIKTAEDVAVNAVKNRDAWLTCDSAPAIVIPSDQCNSTVNCKDLFGSTATDCRSSKSDQSVCMCGSGRCDATPNPMTSGESCVDAVLNQVAKRAYRRPLTTAEATSLRKIYNDASKEASEDDGLTVLITAILASPNFIYYTEFGEGDEKSPGVIALTQHELAARLASYLWRSAPDEMLLAAADAGELSTDEQIMAQATRLLDDPKAREVIALFHSEWLHLKQPIEGDATAAFVEAANEDTIQTVLNLVFEENASLRDFFTVTYGFLNDETKALYEVTGDATGAEKEGYARYDLSADRRKGLLTRGGFLNSNTPPSGRGIFIRQELLCGFVPPPPADVDVDLPELGADASPREQWLQHIADPSCGSCHALIDPLGFAFDHYDRKGKWQDFLSSPSGKQFPVLDEGEIIATTDIDGSFSNGNDLQAMIADSIDTRTCYNFQWLRFATGITPTVNDLCSLAEANQTSAKNDYTVRDVILSVVLTDAFRYFRPEQSN